MLSVPFYFCWPPKKLSHITQTGPATTPQHFSSGLIPDGGVTAFCTMAEIAVLSAEEEAAHTTLHNVVLPLARKRTGTPDITPPEQIYRDCFEVVLAIINERVGAMDAKMASTLRNTVINAVDYEGDDEQAYTLAHRLGAALMIHTSRYEDAEKALRHSMAGMTRIYGELSTEVVQVCATLSTLLEKQGQYKKAVVILVRVLKAQESSLGKNARMTLNTVSNLSEYELALNI